MAKTVENNARVTITSNVPWAPLILASDNHQTADSLDKRAIKQHLLSRFYSCRQVIPFSSNDHANRENMGTSIERALGERSVSCWKGLWAA